MRLLALASILSLTTSCALFLDFDTGDGGGAAGPGGGGGAAGGPPGAAWATVLRAEPAGSSVRLQSLALSGDVT